MGYGHPMYPEGDPRAQAILDAFRKSLPKRKAAPIFDILNEELEASGRSPTADFAIAAVTVSLGLPRGSAQGIFLVGRAVGWIAHAIEQYSTNAIIRPRARYVGPLPRQPHGPTVR